MSTEDPTQAVVDAEIERALAPYRDLLSPEELEEFRDALQDLLTTHPVANELVRRLRPPPVVGVSGERAFGEAAKVEAVKTKTKPKAGGSR
jgi:hypothetical protein